MKDWLPPELRKLVDVLTDAQLIALVLYGEARSEPVQGIVAVGCVIQNRVDADLGNDKKPDWWGEGFRGICLKAWQFSCLHPKGGEANYTKVLAFAAKLAAKTPITNALERQCVWVGYGIAGDYVIDVTKGSMNYHTATLTPRPSWAMGHTPIVQHGRHVFYNDVKNG